MAYTDQISNLEIGTVLEDVYKNQEAKIIVNVANPTQSKSKATSEKKTKPTASNIVSKNKSAMELKSYTITNYVKLKAPCKLYKGDKVVVYLSGVDKYQNMNIIGEYHGDE
jgi:predicted dinucleotide-binding enzyme